MARTDTMKHDHPTTYEEERIRLRSDEASKVRKQKASKAMIMTIFFLEASAMGGMGYLIYLFYLAN
ncbi:MAG: hypothetical protein CL398_11520 [Acidiferrobacteraceae bacterium]|nr:hypothetical protein [Acidiferrobacteraceae bacterium]|tara:strand:+ start:6394 stop:6591 length:198 start_codon:yes stop_codon:yes gene_type:complete